MFKSKNRCALSSRSGKSCWYMRMSVRLNISDDWFRLRSCSVEMLLLAAPPPVLMVEIFAAPFCSKNWLISSLFYRFWSNKLPEPGVPSAYKRFCCCCCLALDDRITGACGILDEAGLGGKPSVYSASCPKPLPRCLSWLRRDALLVFSFTDGGA